MQVVDPGMSESTQLIGTMNTETGESHWWTESGYVAPSDTIAAHSVALLGEAGDLHVGAADVDAWSEGPWVTVRANLPPQATIAKANAVELRTPTRTVRVKKSDVKFELAGSLAAK
jgi:hypothetical protein